MDVKTVLAIAHSNEQRETTTVVCSHVRAKRNTLGAFLYKLR